MTDINQLEAERLVLQAALDGDKTSEDRNRMGQFATPTALARGILAYGVSLLPRTLQFGSSTLLSGQVHSIRRFWLRRPTNGLRAQPGSKLIHTMVTQPVLFGETRNSKSI